MNGAALDAPTILARSRDDLRGLELTSAAREPLEPERAAELYPAISAVREALRRPVATCLGSGS
jgi:hypothetical protein